jgi:hypothetical protein
MVQSGQGSYSVDTDGIVNVGDVVTVTYEGDNDTAFLKLSHCIASSTPSPTHSPSETPSETVSPSESETTTPSESTKPTESVLGTSHTRHPSDEGTGGTAFTGSDVAGFGLLAAGLAALGLGSLYVARKRGANLDR